MWYSIFSQFCYGFKRFFYYLQESLNKLLIQPLLHCRQIIPIITLWVWHEKAVVHVVIRMNFNMLVVGIRLDEVREFKFVFTGNLLQLSTLIKRIRIICHHQREILPTF